MAPFVGSGASATQPSPKSHSGCQSRLVRLAALPSAVPWARRVLRYKLRDWQLASIADTSLLLLSELVTNAVKASRHGAHREYPGQEMIALSLQLTDTSLLMKVWDTSPALPELREADVTGDHGRGLLLVDFMADAWGHRAENGGKVVWCEVAIPA